MTQRALQKKSADIQLAPVSEKLCFSINDFALANGICRQTVYNEINSGRLRTKKVGRRRLIPKEAAEAWRLNMEEHPAYTEV